jgi:very-short-patch-repair endonuclease
MSMRRDPTAVARARDLRHNANAAEKLMWWILRARQMGGFKFRRQHPIGPYIADFVCLQRRLIIEVDGDTHDGREQNDAIRSHYLEKCGYRVIRFWNRHVLTFTEDVRHEIAIELGMVNPSP